jgi:hypothetical protein
MSLRVVDTVAEVCSTVVLGIETVELVATLLVVAELCTPVVLGAGDGTVVVRLTRPHPAALQVDSASQ